MKWLNLIQNLEDLGFSPKEARVYLVTLELKRALPSTIARKSDIKRGSIHGFLKRLQQRGVIIEEQEQGYSFFRAIEPKHFLAQQRERFTELNRNIKELEHELPKLMHKHEAYQLPTGNTVRDLEGTAQVIIQEVSEALSPIAGLLLIDEENGTVRLQELAISKAGKIMLKILGKDYREIATPYKKPVNNIGRCIAERRIITGKDIKEFVCPSLHKNIAEEIQKRNGIQYFMVCPALYKNKAIGGIIIGFQNEEQMKERTKQIENFMNQAAVALKNAYKYEELKRHHKKTVEKFTKSIKDIKKRSKALIKLTRSRDLEDKEKIHILEKMQQDILEELNEIERTLRNEPALAQTTE